MTAACTIAVPGGTPWDMSYDRFISFPMFHDRVDFCWYLMQNVVAAGRAGGLVGRVHASISIGRGHAVGRISMAVH